MRFLSNYIVWSVMLVFFLLILTGLRSNAQPPCVTTQSISINSGIDAHGAPIPYSPSGTPDPFWTIQAQTGLVPTGVLLGSPAIITTNNVMATSPASSLLSYQATGGSLGYLTTPQDLAWGAFSFTFRRTFTTCIEDTLRFDFNLAFDNYLIGISIDGVPIPGAASTVTLDPTHYAWGNTYTATRFLPAGTHTIDIRFGNAYATFSTNPTSINIIGSITGRQQSLVTNNAATNCLCGNTINEYAAVLGSDSCTNTFIVDAATGFKAGDTVLIIQMKGARINQSNTVSFGTITDLQNAGNYEFNIAQSVAGNNITLLNTLTNNYNIPDGKVQLVRVPYYQNYIVNQPLTALPWNGNKGGILAIQVAGTLTVNADINVSGQGFRGGTGSANHHVGCSSMDYYYATNSPLGGHKGESITVLPTTMAAGRGSAANGGGGGNHVNSGGGGGGNFGSGGRGGNEYDGCSRLALGGEGGGAISYNTAINKVFLGGGGGGGHQNENATYPGTPGGGLIFIEANEVVMNHSTIRANGMDNNTVTVNDGASGGGAGGGVLIYAANLSGTGTVEIIGGKGGDLTPGIWGGCHGPGGGGGGGLLWARNTVPTTWNVDASGGAPGINLNACGLHGSTAGNPGGIMTNLVFKKSIHPFVSPPQPQLTSNSPICAGDTLRLNLTSSYPAGTTFTWSGPSGVSGTGQSLVLPAASSAHTGVYTLSASLGGCTVSDTIHITVWGSPTVNLGSDTGICASQAPLMLQSPQPTGHTYLWQDLSTNPTLPVHTTGTYWLQVTDGNGCVNRDSVRISVVADPVFSLGNDTTVCVGNPLRIGASVAQANYLWSNGRTTDYIDVTTTGRYILRVDVQGCMSSDTIDVTVAPLPTVNLGRDTGICASQTPLVLQSPQPTGHTYLWQDLSTNSTLPVHTTGTYWLQVTDGNGCINRDSVRISVVADPVFSLGNDTTVCVGNPLRIGASVAQANYLWNNGSTSDYIDVTTTGRYILRVDVQGCMSSDTIDVTVAPLPTVNLGRDTGICASQTPLVLQSPQPTGHTYLWQDMSTNPTLPVHATGAYWLQVTDGNGCINRDSVRISVVADPVFSLGNDTTVCVGNPLRIGASVAQANYLWNNGSTSDYIDVTTTGRYILQVDVQGCMGSDTIDVTVAPLPTVNLGSDGVICPAETITLDAGTHDGHTYLWNTGATTQAISVADAGRYTVAVTSPFGCIGRDTILLTGARWPQVWLGTDTSICEGGWILLTPRSEYADKLTWQDGSNESSLRITQPGIYSVTVSNQCGEAADSLEVITTFCEVWLPNAFTPNGDGMNDVFRLLGSTARLRAFDLSIYNRWGQLVFHTLDKNTGWNGRFNGMEQPLGTYVYLIRYRIDDVPHTHKGDFQLIR